MRTVEENGFNRRRLLRSGALSLAGTFFLPFFLNLKGNNLAVSNSFISIFFFGVSWSMLYRTLEGTERGDKRGFAAAAVFSFFFTASLCFGVQLDREENVDFAEPVLWAAVFVWTAILTIWVRYAFELMEKWSGIRRRHKGKSALQRAGKGRGYDRPLHVFLIIFFCWFIVFLAVYPGFFVYDAQDELVQVMTRNFTTHHPLPHVLLLGGTVLLGNKLAGSYNAGIAVYTLLQMLFLAGVFTWFISYMRKKGVGKGLCILTLLYFALFPVIVMFALCSAKDTVFTAALLLLLVFLFDMTEKKEEFYASFRKPFLFGAAAVVMMSFRHNGMYAFLAAVPVLLVSMKGYRKKTAVLLCFVFAVYFAFTAGLAEAVGAETSENQEMLTVPIQQLARTWKYDRESFSDEDLEILYEILPEKALPFYTAKVSDGVKVWFDNKAFRADPKKYISLWARTGLGHPFTYINAWLMTSYGFWYPDTVIDVYRGNSVFTFTYGDSSFFGYEVEEPGVRQSRLPWLAECYRRMSLEIAQQKIPVVSMLFSPGFLFWVYAFIFGYTYYRKKKELLPSFALLFLVWLTVILGPTYLPRYVLILWFALPALAAVAWPCRNGEEQL